MIIIYLAPSDWRFCLALFPHVFTPSAVPRSGHFSFKQRGKRRLAYRKWAALLSKLLSAAVQALCFEQARARRARFLRAGLMN